jgi:hypothetical protein
VLALACDGVLDPEIVPIILFLQEAHGSRTLAVKAINYHERTWYHGMIGGDPICARGMVMREANDAGSVYLQLHNHDGEGAITYCEQPYVRCVESIRFSQFEHGSGRGRTLANLRSGCWESLHGLPAAHALGTQANVMIHLFPFGFVWMESDSCRARIVTLQLCVGEVSAGVLYSNDRPYLLVVGETPKKSQTSATMIYDIVAGTWKAGASRPHQGSHHAAEVINNRLYLFGGLEAGNHSVQIADLQDTGAGVDVAWTFGADLPAPSGSAATAVLDNLVCPNLLHHLLQSAAT